MQLDRPFSLLLVHRDIVATTLTEEWLNLPDFCHLEMHQVYLVRLDARIFMQWSTTATATATVHISCMDMHSSN